MTGYSRTIQTEAYSDSDELFCYEVKENLKHVMDFKRN
jgi:hypothetical protein